MPHTPRHAPTTARTNIDLVVILGPAYDTLGHAETLAMTDER